MKLTELTSMQPVEKGWSGDKKYCVTDQSGKKYLLRIAAAEQYESKRQEFEFMRQLESLGIPMCGAVELGECDEGVYTLHTWIDGIDVRDVITSLSEKEQYSYGFEAGEILRQIHTLPAPERAEDWEARFCRKIDFKLKMYEECPLKYDNGEAFIRHIEENRHLLKGRPQSRHHGDFHIGNLMLEDSGRLVVIDFNRFDHGDPWEEFNRIVWSAQESPMLASGMVDGYFGGDIPMEFWKLLALYISTNTLSSLPWAVPFGHKEIDTMLKQAAEILDWYDGMRSVVPKWYRPQIKDEVLK